MRKSPFLIFASTITVMTLATVAFIQSAYFARILKSAVAKYLPQNAGIEGDFQSLAIQLFPPGIAILEPKIAAKAQNVAGLPAGTLIQARRLELYFRPFQMLSGRVSIHQARIIDGNVKTTISAAANSPKKEKKKVRMSWEDLIEIRAEALDLENTHVELDLPDQKAKASFNAKSIQIEQFTEKKIAEYEIFVQLENLNAETPPTWDYPNQVDSLRLSARLRQDGFFVKDFELTREGTQFLADGKILGDVLRGSGLKADMHLDLRGDLERMLEFLTQEKKGTALPSGHMQFTGKVKADLDHVAETLVASGALHGENVKYGPYVVEKAEGEGSYSAATREIVVKHAQFESREIPKRLHLQPGSGGKVEVGAFKYEIGRDTPVEVPITFVHAHLHWLAAAALKDVYGLDGRVSGKANVRFTPKAAGVTTRGGGGHPWAVGADVALDMDQFQIDNQRIGSIKPLSRLLLIQKGSINGKVNIGPGGLKFDGLELRLPKSHFQVTGGVTFGDRIVYGIQGTGPVDLSEMGFLAENPIRGTGNLTIDVHGPSNGIVMDFTGDLQKFYYLHMDFGSFRGTVSWEDVGSILRFKNLDCLKNRTPYTVAGSIDLGEPSRLNLQANVPSGNINDFMSIFNELTAAQSWFPRTMTGEMTGALQLTGGLALDAMEIHAQINGSAWEYMGERFRTVALRGGYDKGRYYFDQFTLRKKTGSLLGSLSYDAKGKFDWKMQTENFALLDIDHLSRLNVPVRGKITATSTGKGPLGEVDSTTQLAIRNTFVRGAPAPDSTLTIQTHEGKATVTGQGLGNQAKIEALYDFKPGGASNLNLEAHSLDFSPIILLLNPALVDDQALLATVSGGFKLSFLSGKAEFGSGSGSLTDYVIAKTGTRMKLERAIAVPIDRGTFAVPPVLLYADDGSIAKVALRSENGNLSGKVTGSLTLGILEFVTGAVQQATGALDLDLSLSGGLKKPRLDGEIRIRNGLVRVNGVETPFENIKGNLVVDNWDIGISQMDADLAGGGVSADGEIKIFADRYPALDLSVNLSGNRVKIFPFQVVKVRGHLGIHGSERPYLIDGKIFVENAISKEKLANAGGVGSRSAQYTPAPTDSNSSDTPLFKLGIDVSAPGNVIVQNELMDLEAKGDLRIVNTLENPRPLGTASAVQGKIIFKDRIFTIQSSSMEFDNPNVINPRFEVLATTEVANRKIQMAASGRFDKYQIEFTSNPPLPDNEILSLLALGTTSEDFRKPRAIDRSAYQQAEAASLVLNSLDFNREVQNKTGLQIQIDEAADSQVGLSAFQRKNDVDVTGTPKIVIKRQLGKRVEVSVGSTVGVGSSIQREVSTELHVTNGFSVLGVWDTYDGATNTDQSKRTSYGVDLKVQKRFK